MTIGERIKFLREKKGINLSELAKRAGVAKSTLFKIEENKTNPTINTIWAIAEVLGVSFSELSGESEIKEEGVSVVLLEKSEEFESFKMNLKKGAKYIAKPHFAGAIEKIYVLNGDVKLGSIDNIKLLHSNEVIEFRADKIHIYEALTPATLIVSIYYPKERYFNEDIFVDVFDEEVYNKLNEMIKKGVGIIRVIAKVDKFDAENVVKNEFGIFIYGDFEVKVDKPLSIREYERIEILKNYKQNIYAAYLALIGEVEMAKELIEKRRGEK